VVRARMGGWSEYFVAMFPAHQQQHRRRPISTPDPSPGTSAVSH
jgi:pyruvate-formate lyase